MLSPGFRISFRQLATFIIFGNSLEVIINFLVIFFLIWGYKRRIPSHVQKAVTDKRVVQLIYIIDLRSDDSNLGLTHP